MNTKTLISGILGGIAYFLLGWLIYGYLMKDAMTQNMGSATGFMRADDDMILWAIAAGNIIFCLGIAYILGTWSGVTTAIGGAKAAAIIGGLFALGYDLIFYGTTHISEIGGVFVDVLISTFMAAISGAVIGWWLGRS